MTSKLSMAIKVFGFVIILGFYCNLLICQENNTITRSNECLSDEYFTIVKPIQNSKIMPESGNENHLTIHIPEKSIRVSQKRDKSRVFAIIIGISKYRFVENLNYADRDALVFANYLSSREGMNLDSTDIHVFINEEATKNNIGNALTDILKRDDIAENDKVIFYFSGHGDYDALWQENEALLLLYGCPKTDYFSFSGGEYLEVSDLYNRFFDKLINKKRCQVIFIADACHSGAADKQLSGGGNGAKVTQRVLEGLPLPTKLLSCKSNQRSYESEEYGGGMGLFTYTLMDALYGVADNDNDGLISLRELQRYLEDNVPKLAKIAGRNLQDPVINTDNGLLIFSKVSKELLASQLEKKRKNIPFSFPANGKSRRESWFKRVFNKSSRIYKTCRNLITDKRLDEAYEIFKKNIEKDTISVASIELRRMLSAAFQQKAMDIILPMAEKVGRYLPEKQDADNAFKDLEVAVKLLGEDHYLSNNMRARLMFLKALAAPIPSTKSQLKEVTDYLKESIKLEPNGSYAHFLIGNIYHQAGFVDSAKKYYSIYTSLIHNSSAAFYNIGLVYAELGNEEEAINNFEKALVLNPTSGDICTDLGILYNTKRKFDASIPLFKTAIDNLPKSRQPHTELGDAYYMNRKYDSAIGSYQMAFSIKPLNREIKHKLFNSYIKFGDSCYVNRQYVKGKDSFEKAVLLDNVNATVRNTMGNCYWAIGDLENARYNYSRALEQDPKNKVISENYKKTLRKIALKKRQ